MLYKPIDIGVAGQIFFKFAYFNPTRTTGGKFANSSSEYKRPLVINAKPVPQSNEKDPLEFGVASRIVCMFSAKVKWLLPM